MIIVIGIGLNWKELLELLLQGQAASTALHRYDP